MKILANDIRVGNVLVHKDSLWAVLKTMHTQPGKGGAYMQVELKDIQKKTKDNVRFRSSETVEKAHLEQSKGQFLYVDGDDIVVMDNETFEQHNIPKELLGESYVFLKEGTNITLESYNGKVILASLPETVEDVIADCEPVIKGQTAASSYKPATLQSGVRIMVPPFIHPGDKIVIKVATMEYLERAK